MEIGNIFEKWQAKSRNKQASVALWDSMATSFDDQEIPSFADNYFLQLLDRLDALGKNCDVLDIGCGTGKYSIAIAKRCRSVTGIDFSPKMIEIAKAKADSLKLDNVSYFCEDWHDFDLKKAGWENRFDLVFAHMTPAIQSAHTFQKMIDASRGWCVLSKPTRRTDLVSDAVKKLVAVTERLESADNDIVFAFELLWKQGYYPRIEYEHQQWNMEKTIEQAYDMYINRIKSYRNISLEEEKRIKDYLNSIAKDGIIHEKVNTTITTLYWHKNKGGGKHE